MSERCSRWWGRRPEDLEPELFWLHLVLAWLLAGFFLWRYSRAGSASNLVLGAFALLMGLRGLWGLGRRRARRER